MPHPATIDGKSGEAEPVGERCRLAIVHRFADDLDNVVDELCLVVQNRLFVLVIQWIGRIAVDRRDGSAVCMRRVQDKPFASERVRGGHARNDLLGYIGAKASEIGSNQNRNGTGAILEREGFEVKALPNTF